MLGKQIIGKSDKASFETWGLKKIAVKIDTGAYRCSIDCSYVKLQKIGKENVLHYVLLNEDHPAYNGMVHQTKEYITSKVKSSNGEIEKRYIVSGKIKLFDITYETEFSLSKRTDMKFPVLIGRKLLNNRFIVDTSRLNLSAKHLKLKEKSNRF
jgi:hypothetical protein